MSLNLTVPLRDSPTTRERNAAVAAAAAATTTARSAPRRARSPVVPRMAANRAKSKSPNPSFCSVLSRVKDWELGAFTPKTALADNVDVMNRSNVPFSDSDREMSDQGESKPPSGWTLGSPPREEAAAAAAAAATGAGSAAIVTNAAAPPAVGKAGADASGGANGAAGKSVTSGLVKSALSSNIGE